MQIYNLSLKIFSISLTSSFSKTDKSGINSLSNFDVLPCRQKNLFSLKELWVIDLNLCLWMEHELRSLTRVTFWVFLACHTEHYNSWPMRSWKKATVNFLEHQSTRSWWILSARVCIVDCNVLKITNSTELANQKILILNLDKQENVKCFDSDHIHSLGWMIEALLFVEKEKIFFS